MAYELETRLIEFGTAIEDLDLTRALIFLEKSEQERIDVSSMWRQLATAALQEGRLLIAQRCFAGLNDVSRVRLVFCSISQIRCQVYRQDD